MTERQENPYLAAIDWIQRNNGTGSANGLAKLILSLWNEDAAYSFRECVAALDIERREWALAIITHFLKYGEDQFLGEAGKAVKDLCPRILELGVRACEAKKDFEDRIRMLENS